jgi:hypothetical protein
MSEHITHTAVMEDGARLALYSPDICEPFKITLRSRPDIALLAATTRSGDKFTVQLLRDARERWASRKTGDMVLEKLAYVLGWRCHLASDRTFKPGFRVLEPEHYARGGSDEDEDGGGPSNVSIYQDVVVFRVVYRSGRTAPFLPSSLDFRMESHPAAAFVPVAQAEPLFQSLWQVSLLDCQSFRGGTKEPDKWLKMFFQRFQPVTVDVQRYARAYHAPDPDLMRRYIVEPNFYDPANALITLARSLQRGQTPAGFDLPAALREAPGQSLYAQALERTYRYLHAASEYFVNRIDEEELKSRCDVGKPHVPAVPKG